MRKATLFVFSLLLLVGLAAAQKSKTSEVTRIKSSGANVFKNELSDPTEKSTEIGGDQDVTLLKKGKNRSMVRTQGGIRGWVDNDKLQILKVAGAGHHDLTNVEVVGWLDNPAAVYILDNTNPDLNALPLDRSFANEIVEPKDREQVERIYDEN